MGNGPSRQPRGGYPRDAAIPPERGWASLRRRRKAEVDQQSWYTDEIAYRYPPQIYPQAAFPPQPFIPQTFDPQNVYPYPQPIPYPLPYPQVMLQPGMQPVIPELGPPPPPRDPPPISHSTRSRPRRRMRMPEPEISSSEEGIPVVPGMNTPYTSPNAPVIPGSRSRNGPVTPGPRFPQPQPQPPPPPNIPEPLPQFPVPDPRLASGQYDTPQESHPVRRATTPYHRPREHSEDHISHHRQYSQDQYPRHGDAHLREDPRERNPLPTPPKDVFERSPYVGLLDDLRRPPEETTLRRRTTGNHQIIIGTTLDPGPGPGPIPAPVIVPQDSRGTQSSGEKKQRKGLFRSLSSKLTSSRPKGEPASHSHHQHATSHHTHPVRPSPRPPTQIVYVTSESQSGVSPGPAYAYDSSPSHHHQRPPTPVRHISTPVPFVGPPSPAPSNRSRLSNRAQFTNPPGQAPALPPVIVTTANELAGLTPYSTHPVHHAGLRKVFPTAYHLFEALKFDFRPDVVDRIRKTKTLRELAGLLRDLQALLPRGWEERVLSMMEDALYNKFIQHPDLRALLFSTFGAEIIFEDEEDEFWGDGGASQGANELGKCLVRVRERLREDGY